MESGEPPSHHHHHQPPPPPENSYPPNYTFNSTADRSFSSTSTAQGLGPDSAKKKRGRPRMYSPDTNKSPILNSGAIVPVNTDTGTEAEKRRGRPPGSGKKQLDALGGLAGISFTPHVIMVQAGEDICSKVMAFSQEGPRTICLLSANGAVSNASIRHLPLSGGTVTYEGRYEIISLRGSFTPSESNGGRSRTGGLSVTLAGPDGQVLGGSLSGMLIAASAVQIIVASFIEDGKKPKSVPSSSPVPNMSNFCAPVAAVSHPSQEPSSESSDESGGSPFDGRSVPYDIGNQQPPLQSRPMYSHSGWAAEQ